MAVNKIIVYLFAVLVPLSLVCCQESQDSPSIPGVPNIPKIPNFSGIPNIFGMPNMPRIPRSHGSADSEAPPKADHEDRDHQDRLFFSRVVSCNYTTERGSTCRSCNRALICLSSNVGLIRTCHGLFRFCNQGRCSLTQGSECNPTTSTSTTSVSTTSTSSSTSASTTTDSSTAMPVTAGK